MIKLIASDLDGTLLRNGNKALDPAMFDLIRHFGERGIWFAAASGRQYPNQLRLFEPVKDDIYFICENGALIFYRGRIIHKGGIDRQTGAEILQAIRTHDEWEILLSGIHTSYLQPKTESYVQHMKHVVGNDVTVVDDIMDVREDYLKISVYDKKGTKEAQQFFEKHFGGRVAIAPAGDAWLDMGGLDVNKGTALKKLQQLLDIGIKETIAFGDHYNDIPMMDRAGTCCAMTTAVADLKQICPVTTDSVENTLQQMIAGGAND